MTRQDHAATAADHSHDEDDAAAADKHIPRQYTDIKLNQWQQQLLGTRLEFNDPWVDCLVDPKGNIGKTTVAAVGELKYGCLDVPTVDNGDKITQSICEMLHNRKRDPALIFVDLPRAQDKISLRGIYAAIEQAEKGKAWDVRHKYRQWWFNSPRIWVFTNKMPEVHLLSADRWRFWKIAGGRLTRNRNISGDCMLTEEMQDSSPGSVAAETDTTCMMAEMTATATTKLVKVETTAALHVAELAATVTAEPAAVETAEVAAEMVATTTEPVTAETAVAKTAESEAAETTATITIAAAAAAEMAAVVRAERVAAEMNAATAEKAAAARAETAATKETTAAAAEADATAVVETIAIEAAAAGAAVTAAKVAATTAEAAATAMKAATAITAETTALRKSFFFTVRPPLGATQRPNRYCATRGSAH